MTSARFWPEVAADLVALNEWARTALAIGPEPKATHSNDFPWPTWAPAPGTWVRQAHQGPTDRVVLGAGTWHIASELLCEFEANLFKLAPLCGRDIRIEPDGRGIQRGSYGHKGRFSTFDIRGQASPGDKECWHCRKRALGWEPGPGHVRRPWGDRGADAYNAQFR